MTVLGSVTDDARGRVAASTSQPARPGIRFAWFSLIGGAVFLAGLALQAALTGYLRVPPVASYIVQAVASVEASFLLNRSLTWRDRGGRFWLTLARFNVQKAVTIALNLALYAVLLRLGVPYLLANIALTGAFTVVNYTAGNRLVFRPDPAGEPGPAPPRLPVPGRHRIRPGVSVVIPCRDNQATIRETVLSLLDQDYQRLREIILIGSPGDPTFDALGGLRDERLICREVAAPPGIRDANFKRDAGVRMSTSELVALVDSDIVLPPYWVTRAVAALEGSGASVVAGGMRSAHDTFWGRFTDSTLVGAKTPRIPESYQVTRDDFGTRGRKPPITANALFPRALYRQCPIDPGWSHGSYEDYEWFWRITKAGHSIQVCRDLFGWHQHRRGLRAVAREYRRSSRGCAYFIRAHRDSPLARRRLGQVIAAPLAALAGAAVAAVAVLAGYAAPLGAVLLIGGAAMVTHQVAWSRRLESAAYPVVGAVMGLVFTVGLLTSLVRPPAARRGPAGPAADTLTPARPGTAPRASRGLSWPGCAIR